MTDKFVTVYMRVERISPDPVMYKPYNPVLEPVVTAPIYVRLLVSAASVVSGGDQPEPDGTIITPKGLAQMCADVAAGIRDRHSQS